MRPMYVAASQRSRAIDDVRAIASSSPPMPPPANAISDSTTVQRIAPNRNTNSGHAKSLLTDPPAAATRASPRWGERLGAARRRSPRPRLLDRPTAREREPIDRVEQEPHSDRHREIERGG